MGCYRPQKGYKAPRDAAGNKRGVVFHPKGAFIDQPVVIPCGRCIGCRLEYSRQWAVRIHCEAQMHEWSWFLTLTYTDEKLPAYGSLQKKDFQDFMKRLRHHAKGAEIQYYQSGEYGDRTQRPHYHAILFGITFPDLKPFKKINGLMHYDSECLDEIWTHGKCSLAPVTFQNASYTARYVMKKIHDNGHPTHYLEYDEESMLQFLKEKEYATMSLKRPIGKSWFDKYWRDLYPKDFMTIEGKKHKPPRYFDVLLERQNPEMWKHIQDKRRKVMQKQKTRGEYTTKRLSDKEINRMVLTSTLQRELE